MRMMKERHFTGTKDFGITQREIEHKKIARKAAAEGIVLLENKNRILPLKQNEKIALYGVGAVNTIKGGTGSGDVNEREVVSIYQGMKNASFTITNESWLVEMEQCYTDARNAWRDDILAQLEGKDMWEFFEIYTSRQFMIPSGGKIEKTESEIAVYVISRVAGEGKDRHNTPGDYLLTEEEKEQIKDICSMYAHVIVLINTGGLIDLSYLDKFENIEAKMYVVQPGMEGGNAIADVMLGKVTPCGKLTDSWVYKYQDFSNSMTFSHNNGNVEKEYYTEDIYVGYRYFDTFNVPVQYSFGYGLSYTDFEIKMSTIKWDGKRICITVSVTNTGDTYSGKEVVQIYTTCPAEQMEKEYRRLTAFAKTKVLAPGENQALTIEVPLDYLASYCEKTPGYLLEKGSYIFWVGNSLENAKTIAEVKLTGDVILSKTKNLAVKQETMETLKQDSSFMKEHRIKLLQKVKEENLPTVIIDMEDICTTEVIYLTNKDYGSREAKTFVETLSKEKLVALASGDPGKAQGGNLGAAGISVPGSAGETHNCALEDNLASIVLADGPAGLRLNKYYNVHEGKIIQKPFLFSLEGGIFYQQEEEDPGERYYQYCTAIPVGTLLAQTWDENLIYEVGQMVGAEMQEFNVTLWLAPGMNIHRNPLCGRNFEYYSEDPLISGKMASAMTRGVQSVPGCGTTIKHLACNNQEDNRMNSDSIVTERALREIYLRGFEIAVKEAQPMAIMTSYNLLNGVHLANSYDICTEAVRSEWGFRGLIMTDWTTTEKGPDCTAAGCMRAGNDLVMPGAMCDRENLNKELEEGSLDIEDLKACISRLVNIIWKSNQYEEAVPY